MIEGSIALSKAYSSASRSMNRLSEYNLVRQRTAHRNGMIYTRQSSALINDNQMAARPLILQRIVSREMPAL